MEISESEIDKLLAARQCLTKTLEISKTLSSQIDETGLRLNKISENIPLLSDELRSTYTRKTSLSAVGQHVDRASGPVAAVLKIYDSVRGLERSLVAGPTNGDIIGYVSQIKQLEGALGFLSDNCGLAGQWMEDIVKLLDEDLMENDNYVLNLKRSLRILNELMEMEARSRLHGGVLSDLFNKLETEFRRMVKDNAANSPEFRTIVERLEANNRLPNCKTIFVDVRSSSSRAALQALNLSYLSAGIGESVSIQKIEDSVVQWSNHMEFAIKQVLQTEYELCKSVFEKYGADVSQSRDLIKKVVYGACEIFKELSLQVELQRSNMLPPPLDASVPRLVTFVTNYCIILLDDDYRPILFKVLSIHQIWCQNKPHKGILRKELQVVSPQL